MSKNGVKLVRNPISLGFFQLAIFGSHTQQPMETYTRSMQSKPIPQGGEIQNGDSIRTLLQQGVWVTSIDLKDAYFHIPIQEQSRKS